MQANPERFVAVDWSGALSAAEQRRRIVVADWRDGNVTITNGRTREETTEWLIAQARQTPSIVVGLDFSFSFPAWFVERCGADTIEQFWKSAAAQAEHWLSSCEDPFWGRPGKRCPGQHRAPHWRGYRACERPGNIGGHPSSTFQIGGAGAVGTGSLRGVQTLLALRDAGFSVWPFHEPTLPCVLEIYPRSFTGPVFKSRAIDRAKYLEEALAGKVPAQALKTAGASEDAFDALCSVIGMARQAATFGELHRATDIVILLEGAIFPGRAITAT